MAAVKPGWERRRLRLYAFWLAVVVSLSSGMILVLWGGELNRRAIFSSIGLNLVASVIFALIFSWFSGGVQQRILLDTLREEQRGAANTLNDTVEGISRELFRKLAGYEKRYMPEAVYSSSNEFDRDFNMAVSDSIENTSTYSFRGTSAKYVAVRLGIASNKPRQVKVSVLHPGHRNVLSRRAADRAQHSDSKGKSLDSLIDDIKNEILMSLVALYDNRYYCDIEVVFAQESSVTRIELLDDALYLSWYRGPSSTEARFPETLRFQRGTFLYDVQAQELHRPFQIAKQSFHPKSDMGEGELLTFLSDLTGDSIGSEQLDAWRSDFIDFSVQISECLREWKSGE